MKSRNLSCVPLFSDKKNEHSQKVNIAFMGKEYIFL